MYQIFEPDRFEPSAKWIIDPKASMGGRGYIPSKQNPTAKELKNGIYKPRLTLTNRFNHTGQREATLKVELSIPKMLFGNNFDELTDSDFNRVVKLLRIKLKEMGVYVFLSFLENAPVSAIHYSKNIPLTDGTTPRYYIKKIKSANVPFTLDVNQSDYRNEGHSFKWHCNSFEVAFYDKIKDLDIVKISGKRAIEKDNLIQLSLFDTLKRQKPFEVLRMEVRLNKRQKIKQILRQLNLEPNVTLHNLFNSKTAKAILNYYLDQMEMRRPKLLDYQTNNSAGFLADLAVNNPTLGLKKAMQVYGLKVALDKIDPRDIRRMFGDRCERSWYRLISEANSVQLPVKKDVFALLHTQLDDFVPVKLVDFQDKMINNDKYN